MDLYRILNVSRNASLVEIKAAYRKLAKQFHPDLNPANRADAERQFKSVNHAYQILSDEVKRSEYDQKIRISNWIPKQRPFTPTKNNNTGPYQPRQRSPNTADAHFNVKTWNAWHYGDDAIFVDAVRQVSKEDPSKMSKEDRYFARKLERERQAANAERQEIKRQQDEAVKQAASTLQERRAQRHKDTGIQRRKKDDCTIS